MRTYGGKSLAIFCINASFDGFLLVGKVRSWSVDSMKWKRDRVESEKERRATFVRLWFEGARWDLSKGSEWQKVENVHTRKYINARLDSRTLEHPIYIQCEKWSFPRARSLSLTHSSGRPIPKSNRNWDEYNKKKVQLENSVWRQTPVLVSCIEWYTFAYTYIHNALARSLTRIAFSIHINARSISSACVYE